ncbi:MAG: hypothetical protein IT204_21485 [Fimbriimonadaceae bacterium]|nr:hypothetical protein [Fimbriimonadaceae bacterium]
MQQAAEIKVGVFVLGVVALALFIASALKGGVGGGRAGYDFEIWFEQAPGVGTGSPVRLAGVDIGEVTNKDVVQVTESIIFSAPTKASVLPLERVRTWSVGTLGQPDYASVVVERIPVSAEEASRFTETARPRSLARLSVQVKRQYEMYTNYRYEIQGGLVFGDRQLNISDAGPDGLPLPADQRGVSILTERANGARIAVRGASPPNIDAIVGNVEKTIDGDTVERAKQIVENIDNMTAEAQKLTAALRQTVEANQGNADRLMNNLATASEDVGQMMAGARASAGEVLANVERISTVGRRIADQNEAKLNRIAGNIDSATATFARAAKSAEPKLDRTTTDLAAIARDVRGLIAANRDSLDSIIAQLAATAGDVKAITGSSREHVDSIMTNVDESLKSIRRVLAESDERLTAIIADTQGLVADARATTKSVRESVEPILTNIREASATLKAAGANVAALTGDPALQSTLNNIDRTAAEARDLLGDLRTITADPQVQADLKATAHSVRNVSEKLDTTLSSVSSFKPYGWADVYYVPDSSAWRADLAVAFGGRQTSFHAGVDNVTADPTLSFQLGRSLLDPRLRVRYGFYRSQLGLGADYVFGPKLKLRTDFYDFGNPHLNAKLTWQTPFGVTGLFGVEDISDRWDWNFGIQIGRPFP